MNVSDETLTTLRILYIGDAVGERYVRELCQDDPSIELATYNDCSTEWTTTGHEHPADAILVDTDSVSPEAIHSLHAIGDLSAPPALMLIGQDTADLRQWTALGTVDVVRKDQIHPASFHRALSYAMARSELEQSLRENSQQILPFVENHADGLVVLSLSPTHVAYANASALRKLEGAFETNCQRLMDCAFETSETVTVVLDDSGQFHTMEARRVPFRWRNQGALLLLLRDITAVHEMKLALAEKSFQEDLISEAASASTVGITIADATAPGFPILYVNPHFTKLTGYSKDEVIGRSNRGLQGPETNPDTIQQVSQSLRAGNRVEVEILNYRKDGSTFWNHLTIDPVRDASGRIIHYVGVQQDVTLRKEYEVKIQDMAWHDSLTGLPNFERLLKEFDEDNSDGVLYLDLDNFSQINEAGGIELGNQVMARVALRLRTCAGNAFCGRIGGDEFGIILPHGTSSEYMEYLANRLLETFHQPVHVAGEVFHIRTSIGGCLRTKPEMGAADCFRTAHAACEWAKEMGKDQFRMASDNSSIDTFKRGSLTRDIHRALARNQFVLYFQPRVHTFTGEIVSCEALLRWNHPEWGIVSPVDFIRLLERSGRIAEVGNWVIREVCRRMQEWDAAGLPPVKISFNVSPRQLMNRGVVDVILQSIEEFGIDASRLELEITEDAVIKNETLAKSILDEIMAHGIGVSIDDFGQGYSSLYSLSRFRMQTVKIDKAFTRSILETRFFTIVRHIVEMAHELGLRVVAEGIETEKQLHAMRDFGCDEIQGFYFSKPLPVHQFTNLLRTGIPDRSTRMPAVNRRKFFRIAFKLPLRARLTITSIGGKTVTVGFTHILVANMGPGGLKFLSNISLPINQRIQLKAECDLIEHFDLLGVLVWGQELRSGIYEYGVKFTIDEVLQERITKTLNMVAIRMKTQAMVPGCDFVGETALQFFAVEK